MKQIAGSPRVSVLVAVYRTEPNVLRETISSVLNQTFGDFELLLLDDCPTDPREIIVSEFHDARVRYSRNGCNEGISVTRNRLMDMANGEYLAILDHDDVCRKDRLEKEVAYLDEHPECGVVSSFTREIPSGRIIERPVGNDEIRIMMMGGCVVAHSASMIRASILRENKINYEKEYSPSEDFMLFLRLLEKTQFHNIPEPLLDYRIHEGNTTQLQTDKMWKSAECAQTFAKTEYPELFEKYECRPKVVVSGGWSYGNLGDDAILEATSRLLKRYLPTANLVWSTYDRQLACQAGAQLDGEVITSEHRRIDRRRSFWMMQTVGRSTGYAVWPKFFRRLFVKFLRGIATSLAAMSDHPQDNSHVFSGAKIFIMSGGGYFNVWQTMFDARIRELQLAHQNGCRVLLIGQSIGPFTERQKSILKESLLPTDVICVRDPESVAELDALGTKASVAPDLALGFPDLVPPVPDSMTVILGELDKHRERTIADQLAKFQKMTAFRYRLRLTQTCSIWSDVASLQNVARLLSRNGIQAEAVMPSNYQELKRVIEGSEWVVSRRLHGMIIGWRSGSKVFSFTKSRKIVGFLEMIGCSGNLCPESDWNCLAERLSNSVSSTENDLSLRSKIAANVHNAFAGNVQLL